MANPVLTSIQGYVEENKFPLLAKSVLGAKSVGLMTLKAGLKGKTAIDILDTTVKLQDGSVCGFTPADTTKVSRRFIEPVYLKVNTTWCEKEFLGTYKQYELRTAAGEKTLPWEEEFTADIIDKLNYAVEKMIWQGDAAAAEAKADGSAAFDGILTQLAADSTTNHVTTTKSDVYGKLLEVYAAIPEAVHQPDLEIMISPADYRTFVQELVAKNMYHYDANDTYGQTVLPGTNVPVIAVPGLDGVHNIVAARKSNIFYGTDMANDQEKFDLWYSKDDQLFKLAIEFLGGIGYAFPNEITWA